MVLLNYFSYLLKTFYSCISIFLSTTKEKISFLTFNRNSNTRLMLLQLSMRANWFENNDNAT